MVKPKLESLSVKNFPRELRLKCKSIAALRGISVTELYIEYVKAGVARHTEALEDSSVAEAKLEEGD